MLNREVSLKKTAVYSGREEGEEGGEGGGEGETEPLCYSNFFNTLRRTSHLKRSRQNVTKCKALKMHN